MIRIDDQTINIKKIKYKYRPDGEIVEFILNGSDGAGGINHTERTGEPLTSTLLEKWFRDNTTNTISSEKISEFLLRSDTASVIEEYATEACAVIWGKNRDETANLAEAFLRYQVIAKEAAELKDWEERRALVASLLKAEHIKAGMFEVKDSSDKYRPIILEDLFSPVTRNTLFSNKSRVASIRLCRAAQDKVKAFLDDCKKIFNYEQYFVDKRRHDILEAIGVTVCPYCNRQFISLYGESKDRYSTADIDHFYNKDRFPFLAMSPYNFIPSCQICNSRFKLVRDFYAKPHINPYKSGFGSNARFEIENIEAIIDATKKPVIKVHTNCGDSMARNSIETFHIEELYQNHSDYAKELINKAQIFSSSQIEEYLNAYDGHFASKEELFRTIYGNYLEEENQGKRPLSKLTQDLLFDLSVRIDYD